MDSVSFYINTMEQYNNPVVAQDTSGMVQSFQSYQGLRINSHIIDVDCRVRDDPSDANAGFFQVSLPSTYKNVVSIELLNAIIGIPEPGMIDNPCDDMPASSAPYFIPPALFLFVGNGITNSNVSRPFAIISEARAPQRQETRTTNTGGLSGVGIDGAFAKIPTVSVTQLPDYVYFRRSEYRIIHRFQSPLASLSTLGVRLVDFNGNLFTPWNPLAAQGIENHIFSLQFEICSQN